MLRINSSARRIFASTLSLALSYVLFIGACAPFAVKRIEATPRTERAGSDRRARPSATTRTAPSRAAQRERYRDGELLVRFRAGASDGARMAAIGRTGGRRVSRTGNTRIERIVLAAGADVQAAAVELRLDPAIEVVEPNYLITADQAALDFTRRPGQRAFERLTQPSGMTASGGMTGTNSLTGAAGMTGLGLDTTSAMRAPNMGAMQDSTQQAVVAVLDTGIDFTRPALQDRPWSNPREHAANNADDDGNGYPDDTHGWDFVADRSEISDRHGHGTAVAALVAAAGNHSQAVSDMTPQARLMSLRVLDETGSGDIRAAVEAIDYAVAHGASVILCAWGTEGESMLLSEAIARANSRGVVVAAAAGNSARDLDSQPYYPASYNLPNIIAVAAVDHSDQLAAWSNWGARRAHIAAPGTDVPTARMNGGGGATLSGTSAAAAAVAGVAGLVKSERWGQTAAGTRAAIMDGARRVAELEGRVSSSGIVDAAGALAALQSAPREEPTATPSPSPSPSASPLPSPSPLPSATPPRITPLPSPPGGRSQDFRVTPPGVTRGAPGGMPNLDAVRRQRPRTARAPEPERPVEPLRPPVFCLGVESPQWMCEPVEPPPGPDPDFSVPRTRPENETGTPGVDLGSRNYNWATGLVSLPGRAGLDLSLSLHYNSLVWTREGSAIKYNADQGYPAAGFRLGLPIIQRRYYNPTAGVNAYMLVTASGGRTELRQVASNVYEAADGSYTQLEDFGSWLRVRTTDGTQYAFTSQVGGEWRCAQVKDRNGNFISATYDGGLVQTMTDTLGRVLNFEYEGGALNRIWQQRGAQQHAWARFGYEEITINPNFPGLAVYGLPASRRITVLRWVGLADGSRYNFDYTSWGQVWRIRRHAPDGGELNHTAYNLPGSELLGSSPQSDCPRFTERRDWVLWGVMNQSQTVTTTYSVAGDGSWSQVQTPDGTIHKEFFDTSQTWQRGLTVRTETIVSSVVKRWMTISWTQDDTSLPYQKNPRVVETVVGDGINQRRTHIDYGPPGYAQWSLPYIVREYASDGATMMRATFTDYNLNFEYTSRRIIGLVSAVHVTDGAYNFVSKTTYDYDWSQYADLLVDTPAPATQHDRTNYGPGFVTGRGNLVYVARWDVTDMASIINPARLVNTVTGYYATGTVRFARDPAGHQTNFDYADSFLDGQPRNTFAYATTVTDPDGYSATTQYHFDHGGVTRVQTPQPNQTGGLFAPPQVIAYDEIGRRESVTNVWNGAYTRWAYPVEGHYVQTYTTVRSTSEEVYSAEWYDGVGRLRAVNTQFPGSTGGYRAIHYMYDVMGRRVQATNPTEINAAYIPVGDDAAGWVWTLQAYDWMGRPTLTTNPDGTTREATYGGCGCAGGDVVTVRDEAGRRRRLTKDTLGRLAQVEELGWEQPGQVYPIYSTASYSYNARDQLTQINHAGQVRSFGYDGHGRLTSRTTPEQGTMTYAYNADDTLLSTTDARGASTTYTYNGRHLATLLDHYAPSGVAATPDVLLTYDAAGNRTRMNDGYGQVDYQYDQLSRLSSETRTFTGVGSFGLQYQYNLAGQLTQLTNQWGSQIGYTRDQTGQVTGMTGAGAVSVPTYVSNIQYRASGAVKSETYGNGRQLTQQFDNRLRLTQWNVAGGGTGVNGYAYRYDNFGENGGRVTYAQNLYDPTLHRSFQYDQVGRLYASHTGDQARVAIGELQGPGAPNGPYAHEYDYDTWGNMTARRGWGGWSPSFTLTYTGNRVDQPHDAAGNLTADGNQQHTYDATGQQVETVADSSVILQHYYDGDRLRVKKTEYGQTTYYVRSSVLGGQVVAELNSSGVWARGYVYLGTQLLAIQQAGEVQEVQWAHQDPVTKSQRLTNPSGGVMSIVDLDPWGGETTRSVNPFWQPHRYTSYERDAGADDAQMRRYRAWAPRFAQPDPTDASYDLTNPQSLNRYAYVQNDPVNFVDPSGLFDVPTGALRREADAMRALFELWLHGLERYVPQPEGGGGETVAQEPAPPPQTQTPDCLRATVAPGDTGPGYYRYSPRTGSQLGADPTLMNNAQPGAIQTIQDVAARWNQDHPNHPIGIGDISGFDGAGDFGRHPGRGHAGGLVMDIRPMTSAGGSGDSARTNWRSGNYDRGLTRELTQRLQATGNVTRIIFNDPRIRDLGLIRARGHDDHLHVEFRSGIGCP